MIAILDVVENPNEDAVEDDSWVGTVAASRVVVDAASEADCSLVLAESTDLNYADGSY